MQCRACARAPRRTLYLESGKVFRVINTHLDHEGSEARKLGLEQILAHLDEEKLFGDVPVIISGDFNAEPDSEEMKPLKETAGLVMRRRESALRSTISTETIRTIRSARLIILFSKGIGN